METITLYKGDDVIIYLPFITPECDPVEWSNQTAEVQIHNKSKNITVLQTPLVLTNDGRAYFRLSEDYTDTMEGNYDMYVKVTDTSYDRIVAKIKLKVQFAPLFND